MEFDNDIIDWERWCGIFQDIPYFTPIIERIFQREKLGRIGEIRNVTPGTNAVFRVNDLIIKIFVPEGVKTWPENDFIRERDNTLRAMELQISTPELIAHGVISERYEWNYLVYEFIHGTEAKIRLRDYSRRERAEFAENMRDLVDKMRGFNAGRPYNDIIQRAVKSFRWDNAGPGLKQERINYLIGMDMGDFVFVHGDLTGENVLIGKDGDIHIIDFGDSMFAPCFYEFPPVIFDLFACDLFMSSVFLEGKDDAVESVFKGLLMHDFGGDILQERILQPNDMKLSDIKCLSEVKGLISNILNTGI